VRQKDRLATQHGFDRTDSHEVKVSVNAAVLMQNGVPVAVRARKSSS
jgi:hypothetical protein